jgi:uncharacterized protein (DUF362 family)/NAD-dependent dihydropyrimidine dehydrogenase PreA subunit
MSRVASIPATYESIDEAIDRAFELFPVQAKGKKVLIKPNVLRASDAREGIVTHPTVLRSVVDKVEAMGPSSIIVGDNPGLFNYGANEESFKKTGLMEAAKGYYRNIGNESSKLPFNPAFMAEVSVSRGVLDADIVISLPKFKTHGLTVISGAIKNSYGILPGAQKARLHKAAGSPLRFHEAIVDVFRLRVPDLFIVDAVVGMEGNGPASPDLREIGLILASDNGVAMDAVIALMMGCEPARLRFLQRAKELGLGDYERGTIELSGDLKKLPGFKLPPLGGEAIIYSDDVQNLIRSRTNVLPVADPVLCTACGTCIQHCPAGALSMRGDLPVADESLCIVCFCCQELCPDKAISLREREKIPTDAWGS